MSLTWFPDILGPSSVSVSGGAAVLSRRLNIVSSGVTAVDNAARLRTDLTIPNPTWSVVNETMLVAGEWYAISSGFDAADLIRVDASNSGTTLTGIDSGADPLKLVKYVTNIGTVAFDIAAPASPPVGGRSFAFGTFRTLGIGETVRVTWDSVTRVYRIGGTAVAPPVTSLIVLDGDTLALDGNHISNPV